MVTHLASLGVRAVSHDESLHAYYSYELATTGHFRHDPMMHGPFLFHVTAATFRVLGDSEATARLPQALAGIALVPALFFYRRFLGRRGAFLAAVFVSFSPSILFYGRYARNDVFMALFALAWLYGALRYLESRRLRFFVLAAVAQSLSFCAKETAFLTGLSFGTFCAGARARARGARSGAPAREPGRAPRAADGHDRAAVPDGVRPPAGWLESRGLRQPGRARARRGARARGLRRLGALRRGLLPGERPARPPLPRRGSPRRPRSGRLPIALFTTFFTNVPRGLTSGLVGSLGYWLGQHGIARGGQPWFYYLLLGALYEPLTIGLALAVAPGARAPVRPRPCVRRRDRAPRRGGPLSSLVAYSIAGEKMPWLLVHVALPACLLSRAHAGAARSRPSEDACPRSHAAVLLAAPTASRPPPPRSSGSRRSRDGASSHRSPPPAR